MSALQAIVITAPERALAFMPRGTRPRGGGPRRSPGLRSRCASGTEITALHAIAALGARAAAAAARRPAFGLSHKKVLTQGS
ncbi:hypothetical protein CHELA40_15056 [Chelatococcus asaccharovorans]|nr:hypothetical protein CHELA40_15056 [Chelatococcus asaccharovorans]